MSLMSPHEPLLVNDVFNAARGFKVGDKIEFVAAYDKGVYLVTRIRVIQ